MKSRKNSKTKTLQEDTAVKEKAIIERFYITESTYSGITTVTIRTDNGTTYNFSVQASTSGCGLCILGKVHTFCSDPKSHSIVLDELKRRSKVGGFFGYLATLGDSYIEKFEKGLLDMGFVRIYSYNNKNYGAAYQQHLYLLQL